MSTPARPRVVDAAFWCWLAAAVLLVVLGLMVLTVSFDTLRATAADSVSDDDVRSVVTLFRGTGVIAILIGAGTGYLAGQVRRGDNRFRRAAVALSGVGAAILVLAALGVAGAFSVPLILLIVAAVLVTRPSARPWFSYQE